MPDTLDGYGILAQAEMRDVRTLCTGYPACSAASLESYYGTHSSEVRLEPRDFPRSQTSVRRRGEAKYEKSSGSEIGLRNLNNGF